MTGPLTITVTGGSAVPELVPLALVALAGFGAALATHGTVRRLVGVVLVLCGVAIAIRSALSFGDQPVALVSSLSRPAQAIGSAQLHAIGPALGVFGGLLISVAGVLIAAGRGRQAAAGRKVRRTAIQAGSGHGSADETAADSQDWWKALDAGADPTAGKLDDSGAADSAVPIPAAENPDLSEGPTSDSTVKPTS